MDRVCERCAGEDDDLVLVRAPAPGGEVGVASGELWCPDCRSSADHAVVDEP